MSSLLEAHHQKQKQNATSLSDLLLGLKRYFWDQNFLAATHKYTQALRFLCVIVPGGDGQTRHSCHSPPPFILLYHKTRGLAKSQV